MKSLITLFSFAILLVLSACGQKGDLYQSEDVPPPTIEKPTNTY